VAVSLIDPGEGRKIDGLIVPKDLYWVLEKPAPLAGMRFPAGRWPWRSLYDAGFAVLVCLRPGDYDPSPLTVSFSCYLEDLSGGGSPVDPVKETELLREAVDSAMDALRSGRGVVVHCLGGRGRTGTVLGCVMRNLGVSADQAVSFLDRVHKARGKKDGWPESPWQSEIVRAWDPV